MQQEILNILKISGFSVDCAKRRNTLQGNLKTEIIVVDAQREKNIWGIFGGGVEVHIIKETSK